MPEGARSSSSSRDAISDSNAIKLGEEAAASKLAEGVPLNSPDAHRDWPEDAGIFQAYTVHFDYDSSSVKASEKSNVAAVADQLKSQSANAVRIDGHCDERGTEEYNRSLGERRAIALREELIRLGIDPGRVDTRSYGEDKPSDPGHNEAAYAKNRRGDFILLTPPK